MLELPAAAMSPGGRNRPPYIPWRTAGEIENFIFAVDISFPGTHFRQIVGRAFTPAAKGLIDGRFLRGMGL